MLISFKNNNKEEKKKEEICKWKGQEVEGENKPLGPPVSFTNVWFPL